VLTFIADGITNDAVVAFNSTVQGSLFPAFTVVLGTLNISKNTSILQPFKTALTAGLPNGTLPGSLTYTSLNTTPFTTQVTNLQTSLSNLNTSYNNLVPPLTDGILQSSSYVANATLLKSNYGSAISNAITANGAVTVAPVNYTANTPISGYPSSPPYIQKFLDSQLTYLQSIQSGFPSPFLLSQAITAQQVNLVQSAVNGLRGAVGVLSSMLDGQLFTNGNIANTTAFSSIQSTIAGLSTSFANGLAPNIVKYNNYRYMIQFA